MTKVTLCGSAVVNASATSVVVTLTEAVPVGDTIVFAGFCGFATMASVSAVDSKGNTWDWVNNQFSSSSSNGPYQVGLVVRTPLAIGDTVTLTFRLAAGGTSTAVAETRGTVIAAHMTGARDLGGAQPDVLNVTGGNALTSTTPAPNAGTAPSPPVVELMSLRVAVTTDADPVTAIPAASGWAEVGRVRLFAATSGIQEVLVWRLKTTATPIAVTETFTLNASLAWRTHVASWMVLPAGYLKFDVGPNEIQTLDVGPYEYFATPLTTLLAVSVPSAEAFGVATITQRKTLTATGIPTPEAFTAGIWQQLMMAQGVHPSNDDARVLVTGPEDLSGKRFTNPVTLTGAGLVATGVAFSRLATFQDDVNADFRNAWFDETTATFPFRVSCGSGHTAVVTLRAFQGDAFKGDMPEIDGLGSVSVNLYNGRLRPAPFNAATTTTITATGIPTAEAFGSSSTPHKTSLVATGLPTDTVFGVASVVNITGGPVTTPVAYGPSPAISTTLSAAGPSYTIQVLANGTLRRSDTLAAITIAQTEYTAGTLVIESDTPGTRRTPAAGTLNRVRMKTGKIILRDLTLTTAMGQIESLNSTSDYAIELQGCNGTTAHIRAVGYTVAGWRCTKSPSGLYCGQNSPAAGAWSAFNMTDPTNPIPTPALRVDNFTGHANSGATGPALTVDAALNVYFGGFDPGSQSSAAGLPPQAVRLDASVRVGGTKVDVQDVYIGTALDGTPSLLTSKANSYSVWAGVMKRCGIDAALFPNTAGSRPEKPIWFALTNGTTPGGETSANTTNDQVVAEHFVIRNAYAQNLVNSTARDGNTILQQFPVIREVYDPAVSLALWTPSDVADTWPNGARRFINVSAVRGPLRPRPTVAATMPNGTTLQNKSVFDNTWLHMGGAAGDGVTEFVRRKFDPEDGFMVDGAGTAGLRFKASPGGAQLVVAPNAAQSGGTAVTLDSTTGRTLVVTKPDGTAPNFAGWSVTGVYGIYTSYADANLGANAVETGTPYRRQLSYTGIDTVAGAFLGCKLVPGPSSTPGAIHVSGSSNDPGIIPDGFILRIVAGVAETFYPHGLPTGDHVDIATPGLTGSNYTVTRVDDFHFLINGQTAINWNAAGVPGLFGTYTPVTLHAYGLAGAQTSFAIPAATTLDDASGVNMGQPVSNVWLTVASGAHIRFVECDLPDISLQAAGTGATIELVDCTQNVTPVPGKYDYDEAGKLGVAGKYDAANQHVPRRMIYSTNVIQPGESLWMIDGCVSFGSHGDYAPGKFADGSYFDDCHVEHGRDIAAPTNGGANNRDGIGSGMPSVNAGPHGDLEQWYDRSTAIIRNSRFLTNAHSVAFSQIQNNWDIFGLPVMIKTSTVVHSPLITIETCKANGDPSPQTWTTGTTVATVDGNGLYATFVVTRVDSTHFELQASSGTASRFLNGRVGLVSDLCAITKDSASNQVVVTLGNGATHGLSTGDTVIPHLSTIPALNGVERVATVVDNFSVLLQGSTWTANGTCELAHSIHLAHPGIYRSDLLTTKSVDTTDPFRLSPAKTEGNVNVNLAFNPPPFGPPRAIIPGELDYTIRMLDNRIMTNSGANGEWLLADPADTFTRGSFNQNVSTQMSATIMQGYMKGSGTANLAFIDTAAQVIGGLCKGGHASHVTLSSQFSQATTNPSLGVFNYTTWTSNFRAWLADFNSNIGSSKTVINKAIAKGAGTDLLGIFFGCESWKNSSKGDTVIPNPTNMQNHANAAVDWIQAMNAGGRPVTHVSVHQEYKGRQNLGLGTTPAHWTINGLPLYNASGTDLSLSSVSSYGNFAWETDSSYNPDTWVPNAPGVGAANDSNYDQYYAWAVTKWYNVLWDTIKGHADPVVNRVKVGGPHCAFGGSLTGTEHTLPLGDLAGTIGPYYWDYFAYVYWLKWSHGFDFTSLDYSIVDSNDDAHANPAYIVSARNNMGILIQRVRQLLASYPMSSKATAGLTAPQVLAAKRAATIHMIEFYWDVKLVRMESNYKESEQAMLQSLMLQQLYTNGVDKAHWWQPMSDVSGTTHLNYNAAFRNTNITSTVSSTQCDVTQGGASGSAFQNAIVAKLFPDFFPVGTPLYNVTSTDSELVAMLSDTNILVTNTNLTTAKTIKIAGNAYTLPAKGTAVYPFAPSIDLGSTNRNAWVNFGNAGAALPGSVATPTLT